MNGAVASRSRRRRKSASERDVPPSRTGPGSFPFTRRIARQARRRMLRLRGRLLLLLRLLPVRDLAGNSSSERSRWVGPSCRQRKWLRRSRSRLQSKRKRPTQMTGMLGSRLAKHQSGSLSSDSHCVLCRFAAAERSRVPTTELFLILSKLNACPGPTRFRRCCYPGAICFIVRPAPGRARPQRAGSGDSCSRTRR